MKSTGNREIDDLQVRYQELSQMTSGLFSSIGRKYYMDNCDNVNPEYAEQFSAVRQYADEMKAIETRIKFLNGVVVCSKCGLDNGVNSSFCSGCGSRLPHTFANDGTNRCTNCGHLVAPGQKFCGSCGALIQEQEENSIRNESGQELNVCPSCGTSIEEKDSMFCPSCGAKLQ